jgi:hypothetical protein
MTMTEASGQLASPLACFIAGALVPITYFYLATKSSTSNGGDTPLGDDDWDDDSDDDVQQPNSGGNTSSSWGLKDAPYKMVLCVNQELGMGKGTLLFIASLENYFLYLESNLRNSACCLSYLIHCKYIISVTCRAKNGRQKC